MRGGQHAHRPPLSLWTIQLIIANNTSALRSIPFFSPLGTSIQLRLGVRTRQRVAVRTYTYIPGRPAPHRLPSQAISGAASPPARARGYRSTAPTCCRIQCLGAKQKRIRWLLSWQRYRNQIAIGLGRLVCMARRLLWCIYRPPTSRIGRAIRTRVVAVDQAALSQGADDILPFLASLFGCHGTETKRGRWRRRLFCLPNSSHQQ